MFLSTASASHISPRSLVQAQGFTLQEMLVSLLIGGTLVSGGASLHGTLQETSKTAAANELVTHLNFARSEAIKRHARVMVCPSQNRQTCLKPSADYTPWQHGWLVYVDENDNGEADPSEIVRVHEPHIAAGATIHTSKARGEVTYQPTGTAGGSTITFALCDARGPKLARYVTISNSGRPRVSRTTTSTTQCPAKS